MLPGCGSDKGLDSDTDTETSTDTNTSTDTDASSFVIGDISVTASSYSINPQSTTTITAIVYSPSGAPISDVNVYICASVSFVLSVCFYFLTVYLFKVGYKLRT